MNKCKIVYLLPYTYWGGGLQMNRLTLLEQLVKRNDLEIIICVLQFSGKVSKLFKDLGLKEYFLNKPAKFYNIQTTLTLYKTLSKLKPDIVHTANVDADIHGFLATRFLKNTKLVVEEIGSSVDRKQLIRKIHHFIYERADKVLCVSPDILNDMRILESLSRQDVEITYNPVNLNHLSKSFNTVDELKTKHNISDDIFVFGIISRFELFKGHTFLFQAFKKLLKEQPNCVLVVTGDGPLKQNFKKEVASLGISENVIFTGMIENVGDYLNLFDIFVHPSLKEPFGIAIIEAMYLKKPVISTNVGGPKEYIDHGVSGLLVPPYNIELLCEAMLQLLSDENYRISLGKNANLVVENRFLPQQYAKNIYDIYKSI